MIDNYLEILQQYKIPKISYLFSQLPLPYNWNMLQLANKMEKRNNQTDYLIDLYHFREIIKLLELSEISKLEEEFKSNLNQELFILMMIRILEFPADHLIYIINGSKQLYDTICWQYQITQIDFQTFVNFYYQCQQGIKLNFEDLFNDQLKEFEKFKKDKYGFQSYIHQDLVEHKRSIKKVYYCSEYIISLDDVSDNFRIYDQKNIKLLRTVNISSKKHKSGKIIILDIFWAEIIKNLGACCQDYSLSIWTLYNKFQQEYSFSTKPFGIQKQILYLDTIKSWVTLNQEDQLILWTFTYLIESNDNKRGTLLTNSSTAQGKILPYKGNKILFLQEIPQVQKLLISSADRTVTIWNPIKQTTFAIIDIPKNHLTCHTIKYSQKLNIIFTVGFTQEVLLWQMDEVNEICNKIDSLTISEPGCLVSALEVFDEFGIIITLDDAGILRAWDIQNWNVVYRFDLGFKINDIVSMIIKLEIGRFLIGASRVQVLEFPSKVPRKIKSKFKPLDQIVIKDQIIYVASSTYIYGLNYNNCLIEERQNLKFHIKYFYVIYDILIGITTESNMYILNDIFYQNKIKLSQGYQSNKEYKEYLLFDDKQLSGVSYHDYYKQLTIWNKHKCRIYTFTYNNKQFSFQKARQIASRHEIMKVINQVEKNVIAILQVTNIIYFLNFNNLHVFQVVNLQLEIIDFFMIADYYLLAIQVLDRLLLYRHDDYQSFDLFNSINIYNPDGPVEIDIQGIQYQQTDNLLNEFQQNQIKYLSQTFYKSLEQQQINQITQEPREYNVLKQIKELRQRNVELDRDAKRISLRFKFKQTVQMVINLIRSSTIEASLSQMIDERKSLESNPSRSSYFDSTQQQQRRNAQTNTQIQKMEVGAVQVDLNQYNYHIANILEDFNQQYYLIIKSDTIKVSDMTDILSQVLKQPFEYYNKTEFNKILGSLNEEIQPLKLQTQTNNFELKHLIIDHNSIQPIISNFYDKLILFSFGKIDNTLKIWDITQLKQNQQLILDKSYLDLKYQQISILNKLQNVQDFFITDIEIQNLQQTLEYKTDLLRKTKTYNFKTNYGSGGCIGQYLLALESKIFWQLKDFNTQYRLSMIHGTGWTLKKMISNWQEANKYQQYQFEHQISKKQKQQSQQKFQRLLLQDDEVIENTIKPRKSIYFTQAQIQKELEASHSVKSLTSRSTSRIAASPRKRTLGGPSLKQINTNNVEDLYKLEEAQSNQANLKKSFSAEKTEQLLKGASKRLIKLNNKLDEIYNPNQQNIHTEQEKKKKPINLNQSNNPQAIFHHFRNNFRLPSKEKLKLLKNIDFQSAADKIESTMTEIKDKFRYKLNLTPINDYLSVRKKDKL